MHAGETGVFCHNGLIDDAAVPLGLRLAMPGNGIGEVVAQGEKPDLHDQNLLNRYDLSRFCACSAGWTGGLADSEQSAR